MPAPGWERASISRAPRQRSELPWLDRDQGPGCPSSPVTRSLAAPGAPPAASLSGHQQGAPLPSSDRGGKEPFIHTPVCLEHVWKYIFVLVKQTFPPAHKTVERGAGRWFSGVAVSSWFSVSQNLGQSWRGWRGPGAPRQSCSGWAGLLFQLDRFPRNPGYGGKHDFSEGPEVCLSCDAPPVAVPSSCFMESLGSCPLGSAASRVGLPS